MVFEGRVAEMLQNQASRFLRGFSYEQLRLGLLSGRLELHSLALNPEPLDSLLLESEIPFVVKAGVLMSCVVQLSLLQGELELVVDGLVLVLGPVCRWLTRTEVFAHRVNEIQRLEFVHMRSQCQRRTLEREMFRQLFGDYLSRLKITIRNVHVRVEIEGEMQPAGTNAVFGMFMSSASITPLKSAVTSQEKDGSPSQSGELLLAERVSAKALSFYHESGGSARVHIRHDLYNATRDQPLGVFEQVKQDQFMRSMMESQKLHAAKPASEQLMPPTGFSVAIDLRSQPIRDGFHVDGCLTMEITVRLDSGPSCMHLSLVTLEHIQWMIRRTLDFQVWQYLHPLIEQPRSARERWRCLRSFVALRRRIHYNSYSLSEAIKMRMHCKEYVRLYKKKFNGPASVVAWRKPMPALTPDDAVRLGDIELVYPADKLVNFRLMAHAELKTEMALNSILNSDEGLAGMDGQNAGSPYRRAARELTPLEQLHLHGQHGYGVNIYRGLPPPPSSLKIRIDVQAPQGLWWICSLNSSSAAAPVPSSGGNDRRRSHGGGRNSSKPTSSASSASMPSKDWAVAIDCTAQPIRLLLVDSVVDASVFATIEVPATTASNQRPLALLLGRTAAAFANGSPGRGRQENSKYGGTGPTEWCSVLEFDGTVYCCSQLKTVLTSSPNSPWDIFMHLSCGETVDVNSLQGNTGFSKITPMDNYMMTSQSMTRGGAADHGRNTSACVKIRLPLTMASGQPGPFAEMLKNRVAAATHPISRGIQTGAGSSLLGWLARRVSVTYDIAMLRFHLRIPPTLIEGDVGGSTPPVRLPRLDAAMHIEHGGLVDGFVVGLHQLRYFIASLLSSNTPADAPRVLGGGRRGMAGNAPCSLLPLEQAPPLSLLICGVFAALAVAVGSRGPAGRQHAPAQASVGATLSEMARKLNLKDVVTLASTTAASSADVDSPAAVVTLMIVLLAVVIGRRALWDTRDSKLQGRHDLQANSAEVRAATSAVAEVHSLFATVLTAAMLMGFPLHSRCLPLAAWAGAKELMEAVVSQLPANAAWPPHGLTLWAARGAYSNLQARQEEVIRWLLRHGARIDECDKAGRTILDWACWSGAEDLAKLALRAGLLPVGPLRSGVGGGVPHSGSMPAAPSASRKEAPEAGSPRRKQAANNPGPSLMAASPLTLAVAGRSPRVVALLLRAAGDPHTTLSRGSGSSCGPLLLAVRNCEYELACEVLKGSPFVNVEAALGPAQTGVALGVAAQPGNNYPHYQKGDGTDAGPSATGTSVRATVALVDSLRRFSGALSRRTADDAAPGHAHMNGGYVGYVGYGGGGGGYGGGYGTSFGSQPSGLQTHSQAPGAHPDEGLFAAGQLPFGDILHPLALQLSLPVHKVGYDNRPHLPPHRWLRRGASNSSPNPWAPAHFFVECCLSRGFRPDSAVIARALPALPSEARRLVQHLFRITPMPGEVTPSHSSTNGNYDKVGKSHNSVWLGEPPEGRRENGEVEDLSVSFANEIRHLRTRTHSSEGVPPIDIAAALGAAPDVEAQPSGSLSPRRDSASGRVAARTPHTRREPAQTCRSSSGWQGQVHRMDASPGPPSIWLAVSLGTPTPVAGPIALESLCVDGTCVAWTIIDQRGSNAARPQHSGLLLKDVGALRRFELSGGGTQGGRHVLEISITPDASASSVVDSILLAGGQMAGVNSAAYSMNGGMQNGNSVRAPARHAVSLSFAYQEHAEKFAGMLQSCWQSCEQDPGGDQLKSNFEEVSTFLHSGPWDSAALRSSVAGYLKASSGARDDDKRGPVVTPLLSQTSTPAVRVVVLGAPSVGKTKLSRCIHGELNMRAGGDAANMPLGIHVTSGLWPKAGKPRAEVCIWDTSSVPLVGMMQRLVSDFAAATIMVVVVDASLSHLGAPADALVATCVAEAAVTSSAPRRTLVVENMFSGSGVVGPPSVPSHSRHSVVRGNLETNNECRAVGKLVSDVLKEIVGELESRSPARGAVAPQPLGDYGPWSAVVTARPLVTSRGLALDHRGDRALAACLAGDATFLHPSAVAWAWSAILAAQGSFTDCCDKAVNCGGAVVPWDRLERVLSVAEASAGPSVGHLLLRTLADLGLVCPIPAYISTVVNDHKRMSLGSNLVLVPDFAPRQRLTSTMVARLGCGALDSGDKNNAAGHKNDDSVASTLLSARLVWDAAGGAPPQLRTVLRNFIVQGAIGSYGNGGTPRCLEMRRFALLEVGPTGVPRPTAVDSISPGFLMVFDLVPASMMQSPSSSELPEASYGSPVSKPPPSVRDATPSGAVNESLKGLGGGSTNGVVEDDFAWVSGKHTTIIVGASSSCAGGGDTSGASSSSAPFWDVYCSGPHAQWAWRALLGSGATTPSFTGFRKSTPSSSSSSSVAASASEAWPLPRPACTLSTMPPTSNRNASSDSAPTGKEFVCFSWLFNGPNAASARSAFLPPEQLSPMDKTGVAAWCAGLCNKKTAPEEDLTVGLESDEGVVGLMSLADFEAALLARRFGRVAHLLDEALAGGLQAWALCSAALARVAHDAAAGVAGGRGRALPLICSAPGAVEKHSATGSGSVALVPEGARPLLIGTALAPASSNDSLGAIRLSAGVQAWLRLCRPMALWSTAGSACGFVGKANEPSDAAAAAQAPRGAQVVEALQAAFAVQLSEQMVMEVWDALSELDEARTLIRRAGGTWAQVASDSGGFVL